MTPDNCVRVLSAGGNLVVKTMTADNLVRLATVAAEHNTHLTVRGAMTADNMVRIARAGKGHVTFDVSDS